MEDLKTPNLEILEKNIRKALAEDSKPAELDDRGPLYRHWLSVDEDRRVWVDTVYREETGIPLSVYRGTTRRFPLPSSYRRIDPEEAAELAVLIERAMSDHESGQALYEADQNLEEALARLADNRAYADDEWYAESIDQIRERISQVGPERAAAELVGTEVSEDIRVVTTREIAESLVSRILSGEFDS